ncbi:MAG: OmpA family protein [Rhodospirillaceae bacterium]|jgi:peptidoglycan-associated lipoprotein|nr:OmpA family protein [Rhodospirillaceae bacterium]MBT5458986.1 OmpA family protein [Rhodospirillaceae bacterium]
MRWKILLVFMVGLGLAACETTPPENAGSTNVTGSTNSNGVGAGDNSVSSGRVSSLSTGGPRPGSQEDLVTNVGDRIFFAFDSIQLSVEARATLEKQSQWLKQNSGITVWVEGHADERGTREYNLALAERRAVAIRDYLVALGVGQNRLQTRSFGKERPVDPRSVAEAWDKNRRGVMAVR